MRKILSPRRRALVWRDLWIELAAKQASLGLSIAPEQVESMRSHRDDLDLERVAELELELRHDVMAHVHHFGEICPEARGIIHWGATSCYVTDNGDALIFREALDLVADRLLAVIHSLADFAAAEKSRPTLGWTHLQPAQLTTVGKRAATWVQDLVWVYQSLTRLREEWPFRGVKGTTGTQASFLQLFGGDGAQVDRLERAVAEALDFREISPLTGQTYSRLWDYRLLSELAGLGVVLHKISNDLRILQSWGEIEEPYEEKQIGSSAMPYKRNPMRSERLSALAKALMGDVGSVASMAATQWFERTLDDSALRRIKIPGAFLLADSMLILAQNISCGLIVHPEVIERRVREQLPFMAAEEVLMEATQRGGDRQDLHEKIRQKAWQAANQLRARGGDNPLRELLEQEDELREALNALPDWDPVRFTGRAAEQTERYLRDVVDKLPRPRADSDSDLRV